MQASGLLKLCETLKEDMPAAMNAATFRALRTRARCLGGQVAIVKELAAADFVKEGKLTTGTKPFNIFARVGSGEMKQPGMEEENKNLGEAGAQFVVACNLPANDEHWASDDAEWVGKASMAERHRFLTNKDMSWEWFNVLTFGLDGDLASLEASVQRLEAVKAAALAFAAATDGWSAETVGLYLHVFPHNSVYSFHLHMLDGKMGPTFEHFHFKNLPLDDALAVLKEELAEAMQGSS